MSEPDDLRTALDPVGDAANAFIKRQGIADLGTSIIVMDSFIAGAKWQSAALAQQGEGEPRTVFISYGHPKGFGSAALVRDFPISSWADIQVLRDIIAKDQGLDDITILNWQWFEDQGTGPVTEGSGGGPSDSGYIGLGSLPEGCATPEIAAATEKRNDNLGETLDALALALTGHKHVWTPRERRLYEAAIAALKAQDFQT